MRDESGYMPEAVGICVTPDLAGVHACHDACVADQTCGCFSVTTDDGYNGGEVLDCPAESLNSYCWMVRARPILCS